MTNMIDGLKAIVRNNEYNPLSSKEKTKRLLSYDAEKRRGAILDIISSSFKSCKEISEECDFALCTINKDLRYMLDNNIVEHKIMKVKMKINRNIDFYKKINR